MATRLRNLRVDDKLWADAKAAAEQLGTTLTDEMRVALRRLVRRAAMNVRVPPPEKGLAATAADLDEN